MLSLGSGILADFNFIFHSVTYFLHLNIDYIITKKKRNLKHVTKIYPFEIIQTCPVSPLDRDGKQCSALESTQAVWAPGL